MDDYRAVPLREVVLKVFHFIEIHELKNRVAFLDLVVIVNPIETLLWLI